MTDKLIVLSTAGNKDEAQKIASALVEQQLAACVNVVGPISSTYRWRGKVEHAEEFLLIVKTTARAYAHVAETIQRLHSYDLPEIIQLSIAEGSAEYLEWIGESVKTE